MPKVYELTGSMGGIVEDAAELVFPNVQTCVAVVAVVGSRLVGAHVTIADRRRLSQVAEAVRRRGVVFRPIRVSAPEDMLHLDLIMAWDARRASTVRDRFLDTVRRMRSDG